MFKINYTIFSYYRCSESYSLLLLSNVSVTRICVCICSGICVCICIPTGYVCNMTHKMLHMFIFVLQQNPYVNRIFFFFEMFFFLFSRRSHQLRWSILLRSDMCYLMLSYSYRLTFATFFRAL